MKPIERREALRSLLGATAATGLLPASSAAAQELSPGAVGEMMRSMLSLEPLPGEEERVRAFLLSLRKNARAHPRIEPALHFDPETDPRD